MCEWVMNGVSPVRVYNQICHLIRMDALCIRMYHSVPPIYFMTLLTTSTFIQKMHWQIIHHLEVTKGMPIPCKTGNFHPVLSITDINSNVWLHISSYSLKLPHPFGCANFIILLSLFHDAIPSLQLFLSLSRGGDS